MEKKTHSQEFSVPLCYNQALKMRYLWVIPSLQVVLFLCSAKTLIYFPFKRISLFKRWHETHFSLNSDPICLFLQFIPISFPLCEVLKIPFHFFPFISPETKYICCLHMLKVLKSLLSALSSIHQEPRLDVLGI